MTKLEPIEQEDFERFLEREIRGYAEDHVRNGNWFPEGAMDEKLLSMNVDSVELHVFGDNIPAQELYKKAGFQIAGIHMNKKLK